MLIELADAAATEALGARLAAALAATARGACIALTGELGAGKTTLVRGALAALGYPGAVISPSYTLIEPYAIDGREVFHLDLYRIAEPAELEYLGVRDIDVESAWLFVEWPENGAGWLPERDVTIALDYAGPARRASIAAESSVGHNVLARIGAP